ncbi:SGNH/GDSL hydrolase family protein [Steroidobacter cummioxidans]|uniref:SGNH/GDSL hydrolase family protein n=1 Tax=Steroidobacter cummioxidans TaxID=1803913 RepID=UPI00129017B8|nr:SGNH/GDSL hydrolase family protein [Steroidobacter cummioxidans]
MPRTIGAPLWAALSAIALVWPSSGNAQQAYPSFHDVDFFYAQRPQVFQALWQAAQTQTLRIAVLGDSQETSPGSHGFQYIPLLNYEMWKRFGNSPETPVVGCFYYGNSGPANWLLAGHCAAPGPTATRLDATQILPNAQPSAFSTLNGASNITGGNRGQLTMLRPDASGVDPSTQIPTDVSYFNTSGVVKARIYAATNVTSGEIGYQARPNATSSVSYAAAVTTRGTLALGLQAPTFSIQSGETSTLDFNRHPYLQLEVFGSSDQALTDVIGLRFVNKTHPQGVVIDNFSLGGYTASRFLSTHANAGQMFSAFGFHAAILHYGANEGGSSSAAQFKSDISAVISRVRTWVGNASFPIILIADVYESTLPAARMAEYDRYVGAQLAIAQSDPNVMVINARRLMENIGWQANGGRSSEFLEDGVHYTGLGARTLSAAEVAAMMGEIHASGCPSDPGAVTLQPSMTLVVDVGGTTACTNHGQLTVARALTLNQATLKVELTGGFTPAIGDQFKVLSFNSLSGTFGTLTLPPLPSGLSWNTDQLYTIGTLTVANAATPPNPPEPPASPPPPTISVTSAASQSITLPSAPAPIAFTLNGSGTLTVSASSDNETVLPDAGISISAGCGLETLACTMSLAPAAGQTGTARVSLTVVDTHSQSAATTITLEIKAAPASEPGTSNANGGQTGNASNGHSDGGGGSMDLLSMLVGLLLLAMSQYTSGTSMFDGTAWRE